MVEKSLTEIVIQVWIPLMINRLKCNLDFTHFRLENFEPNLSPKPLLMYSVNMKDSEIADRWLAVLSSFIIP